MSEQYYLQAVMICDECDHKQGFLLGRDKQLYHECNKGNRGVNAPTSSVELEKAIKRTKGKVKLVVL